MRKSARFDLWWSFYWIVAFYGWCEATATQKSLQLTVPESHVALTRNLTVSLQWTSNDHPRSLLIAISRSNLEWSHCRITFDWSITDSDKVDTRIPCSCFDQQGVYFVRVFDSAETLLATATVRVIWPSISLQIPTNRSALATGPVHLRIALSDRDHRLCAPSDQLIDIDRDVRNGSTTLIEISTFISVHRYISDNDTDQIRKETLIPSRPWWTLDNTTIQIPCLKFIHPGLYQIDLIINIPSDHPDQSIDARSIISKSNFMHVTPTNLSEDYELRVIGHHVYPCPPDKGLPISYRRPITAQCHRSLKYDAVRLYAAQPRNDAGSSGKRLSSEDMFLSLKHSYVAEEKLPSASQDADVSRRTSTAGVAYFGCNHFDLIYPEYCFQLVSVYEDGVVLERGRHCTPTQSTKYTPINGQWSTWQSWSSCTVTCGQYSVQHRLRYCNRPEPADGGQFCVGSGLETRACSVQLCPAPSKPSPAPIDASIDDRCTCGCNLTRSDGGIIAIDPSRCTENVTYWRVIAPSKHQIIDLRVRKIRFRYPDIDWLRIYDRGTLLFDSSLKIDSDDSSLIIQSRSDQLLIEHFAISDIDRSDDQSSIFHKAASTEDWYGVLITYRFLSSIDQRPIDTDRWSWWVRIRSDTKWFLGFIIMASVCTLGCLVLLFFVSAKYTLKKLRSKCHYLMLLSQTTQASTVAGQSMGGPGGPPQSTGRSSVCEIVSIRKPDQAETGTKEPLLSRSGIDDQRKSILKSKYQPQCKNLAQIPEEVMQTSMNTETTRLSGLTQSPSPASPPQPNSGSSISKSTPKSVRSIGIQLSSPALSSIRRHVSSDRNGHKMPLSSSSVTSGGGGGRPESPNFSFAGTEQDDFEYDYYDAPVPGSFFNYQHSQLGNNGWRSSFFETDIDIDDIIDQSDLMKPINNNSLEQPSSPVATKVSVSTQSHPMLAAGDSAESSEWSFKWTKPGTATTQFHFL